MRNSLGSRFAPAVPGREQRATTDCAPAGDPLDDNPRTSGRRRSPSVCNADARLIVELDCTLPPERVLLALRDEPWPFALTGALGGRRRDRRLRAARAARRPATTRSRGSRICPPARGDAEVGGGWFGWLGYGLGALRRGPPAAPAAPGAAARRAPRVLRPRPAPGRGRDAGGSRRSTSAPGAARGRRRCAARLAARARSRARPTGARPTFTLRAPGAAGTSPRSRDCVERIAAGEIFQANLCLRLEARLRRRRRRRCSRTRRRSSQPAYGACFVTPLGRRSPASRPSCSCAATGATVTTGPIKGTAPARRRPGGAAATRRRTAPST